MNTIDSNDNSEYESAYLYKRASDNQLMSNETSYESNSISQFAANFRPVSADTSFEVTRDSIKQKFLARAMNRSGVPEISRTQRTSSTGAINRSQDQIRETMNSSPIVSRNATPSYQVRKSMDDRAEQSAKRTQISRAFPGQSSPPDKKATPPKIDMVDASFEDVNEQEEIKPPPAAHISPVKPAYAQQLDIQQRQIDTDDVLSDLNASYQDLESEYKTLQNKLSNMEKSSQKTISELLKKRDHFRTLTEKTEKQINELAKFEPKLERYKQQESIIKELNEEIRARENGKKPGVPQRSSSTGPPQRASSADPRVAQEVAEIRKHLDQSEIFNKEIRSRLENLGNLLKV